MAHEKVVEIRWSDVDAYLHVNNAVFATYLEECRDEWINRTLEGVTDTWDFVLARVAIDFRRELRLEDEEVIVSCNLASIGNSSVTLREQIRTRNGELPAESEAVLVARDRERGRSRLLAEAERAPLVRALSAFVFLPPARVWGCDSGRSALKSWAATYSSSARSSAVRSSAEKSPAATSASARAAFMRTRRDVLRSRGTSRVLRVAGSARAITARSMPRSVGAPFRCW